MYQVVGISKSPERRFVVTNKPARQEARDYLAAMSVNDGEVVDIRTGLLKHEKIDGTVYDCLAPTRRPIL